MFSVALSLDLQHAATPSLVGNLGGCHRRLLRPRPVRPVRGLAAAVVGGSTMMPEGRSATLSAQGLCEVTVLVPKDCVERIRQFAEELRARQPAEPLPTRLEWQTVSPSAELVVTRDCSARCVVRDTRASGADRFLWIVAVLGQLDPVAEGPAKDRVEARLQAEASAAADFAGWAEPSGGGSAYDD